MKISMKISTYMYMYIKLRLSVVLMMYGLACPFMSSQLTPVFKCDCA